MVPPVIIATISRVKPETLDAGVKIRRAIAEDASVAG
jgi:hypothetical protein